MKKTWTAKTKTSNTVLKAQLKRAQKEAELARLRAKAYDTMINVAEETFNIPIRKKSGTQR